MQLSLCRKPERGEAPALQTMRPNQMTLSMLQSKALIVTAFLYSNNLTGDLPELLSQSGMTAAHPGILKEAEAIRLFRYPR